MDLLKVLIKEDGPAVGLTPFRDKTEKKNYKPAVELNLRKPIFKPNYSNNFFIM